MDEGPIRSLDFGQTFSRLRLGSELAQPYIRPGIHQVFGQLQVKLINDGNFAGVGVDWLLLCLTLILLLRLQSSQIVKVCPLFHAISDPN